MSEELEYKEGFNASFLLAKYEPALLEKLNKRLVATSTYLEGFFDGKKQFDLDKERTELEQLNAIRDFQKMNKERNL